MLKCVVIIADVPPCLFYALFITPTNYPIHQFTSFHRTYPSPAASILLHYSHAPSPEIFTAIARLLIELPSSANYRQFSSPISPACLSLFPTPRVRLVAHLQMRRRKHSRSTGKLLPFFVIVTDPALPFPCSSPHDTLHHSPRLNSIHRHTVPTHSPSPQHQC